MKQATYLALLILVVGLPLFALADPVTEDQILTIGLTEEEKTRLHEIGMFHVTTAPPVGEIRNPAEWEPSTGVIIRYPLGISVSLVAEMSEDLTIWTIVTSAYEASAISAYTSGGVNMANTEFIIAATNSIWTRDYGPWFIFENGRQAITDPVYNRPRPLDDVIPQTIGTAWGINVYGMPLATPGGNHMTDGLGMSMSTRLVWDENDSLSHTEIANRMLDYTGNDFEVLEYIESGGIHHLDCWAKFLNPTTIMVKDVPTGSSSYALLNARADYLATQTSAWGQPYTIVRIYCPYGTAYTNSLILNDKVLVPIFGDAWDDDAIQTYEEAMPGYEVIGFTGSWLDDDAIHCRTMGVPDAQTLFVHHIPTVGIFDPNENRPISVEIEAYSDQPLIDDSLKIFFSVDNDPWDFAMLSATAVPDSFYGEIPAQPGAAEIAYYIQAADLSGRMETHPFIGAPWAHKFSYEVEPNEPPIIISPDSFLIQAAVLYGYCPEVSDPDDTVHTATYTNYPTWLAPQDDSLIGTPPFARELTGFDVEVSDGSASDTQHITLMVYICGDVDDNGENPNIADLTYLVAYLFTGGTEPPILEAANIDGQEGPDGMINIADLTHFVGFLFTGGPSPYCVLPWE
ncbi:MAG: agmatine deiminase family protein [candidate division Zixibacteria bacterium]|nr:agmatine deiminase family protein [candidate division Zixibacteria bacterium]